MYIYTYMHVYICTYIHTFLSFPQARTHSRAAPPVGPGWLHQPRAPVKRRPAMGALWRGEPLPRTGKETVVSNPSMHSSVGTDSVGH